jgi:hypothetical protein
LGLQENVYAGRKGVDQGYVHLGRILCCKRREVIHSRSAGHNKLPVVERIRKLEAL